MSDLRFSWLVILPAIFIIAVFATIEEAGAQTADKVLIEGQFYTVDDDNSWAEAVAIEDGTIIYVGSMDGVYAYIGGNTEVIDIEGEFAMPAFVDAHMHPLVSAYAYLFTAALFDLSTHEEYIAAITEFAEANPDMEGVMGSGFDRSLYDAVGPRKEWLDEIDSERPIGIVSSDMHSMWVNSKVFELLGWDADTPDPPGGIIVRDPITGELAGLLQEMPAMVPAWELFPSPAREDYKTSLLWLQEWLNSEGITTAHDAWMEFDPNYYQAYNELAEEGRLTVRFRGSWFVDPNDTWWVRWLKIEYALLLSEGFNHPHFQVQSFKFMADGSVEEESAYLLEPYSHRPGFSGIRSWDNEAMVRACAHVDRAGYQIQVHVIGDGAARYTLDVLEQVRSINGERDSRHSLAHVQLIAPEDVVRMGELGLTAHMSQYWMSVDTYFWGFYRPYLGAERTSHMYPQRSLIDAGVNVTVASDFNVSEPDVMFAIFSGMERILPYGIFQDWYLDDSKYTHYEPDWDAELTDDDVGHLPPQEECVSLEEMLRAATINGAYANFLEDDIGSIEVGKKADIVVLSENLFEIDTEDIPSVEIKMTFFEGELVFVQNQSSSVTRVDDADIDDASIPYRFVLKQNFPNPFNPTTTIEFEIPLPGNVQISIINISGQVIHEQINGFLSAGSYSTTFDGSHLSSGIYFYVIKHNNQSISRKMILLK